MAHRLGIGVLAVRRAGNLPPWCIARPTAWKYGTATLEIPAEGLDLRDRRVVIIDDVLVQRADGRRRLRITCRQVVHRHGGRGKGTTSARRDKIAPLSPSSLHII